MIVPISEHDSQWQLHNTWTPPQLNTQEKGQSGRTILETSILGPTCVECMCMLQCWIVHQTLSRVAHNLHSFIPKTRMDMNLLVFISPAHKQVYPSEKFSQGDSYSDQRLHFSDCECLVILSTTLKYLSGATVQVVASQVWSHTPASWPDPGIVRSEASP